MKEFSGANKLKYILLFISILAVLAVWSYDYTSKAFAQAGTSEVSARRQQLEGELAGIEKEIEAQRQILSAKQREGVSLERDIAILDAQISKAKLSIRARNIAIGNLEEDINQKGRTIGSLSDKINREFASLAQLLRKTDEIDSASLPEILFTKKSISDFFEDVASFEAVRADLTESITTVKINKISTEQEKKDLESKKSEETALRQIQELEKKKVEQNEAEKQKILKVTKGVEKEYQAVLKSKEQSAASIRTELFTLQGSSSISFEKALSLANRAHEKTGVRPAFLLGIIAEESNLGQNIGTGNWKVDMKAPRDTEPFLKITAALGLDPDKMPVSKKAWYGWGGAMGPAQFIPSTWVLYENEITGLTGHNPPNPWDPEDAFMGSAVLLRDNGAAKGTAAAERLAALRYLAGWTNATKSAYAFYGDDVMALAEKYQKQIDILSGV